MEQLFLFLPVNPPRIEDVKIYFSQKGIPEKEAEHFSLVHEKRGWLNKKGSPFKSWKSVAYREVATILRACPWYFDKNIH